MANQGQSNTSSFARESICFIAKGTQLEGQFSSGEQIRFDGQLVGNLTCAKKVVIGESGKIIGDIQADQIVVMGQVEGQVKAERELHLKRGAQVKGKISTGGLIIDEGAVFEGESQTKP